LRSDAKPGWYRLGKLIGSLIPRAFRVSGSFITMNPYARAPDIVIASPPQISQSQDQKPSEVSQYAGFWIWTSGNSPSRHLGE
jgi:hypothetical protein